MIVAFADFVAGGGQIVVGTIIFVIIIVIQFVVITKGATRISEVAARFALDGMPGKQMAIDADLNAGIIDEREAQSRRSEITQQADFYGAMDGASKFVRGDAIAGILITVINVVGGLIIGVAQFGMSFGEAAHLYTRLTIGDGLVSQVPAFLISLAAGLLVTRSTQSVNLPKEFLRQVFSRSQALAVTGGFLGILMFTSLPRIPLLTLGGACLGIASMLNRRDAKASEDEQLKEADRAGRQAEGRTGRGLPHGRPDGDGARRRADSAGRSEPRRRSAWIACNGCGRTWPATSASCCPKVRIRDNMRLDAQQYRIKIADMPVAQGEVEPGRMLAIDSGMTTGTDRRHRDEGPSVRHGREVDRSGGATQAEMYGYTVVEPGAVLATHLTEVCRRHADEILTRDATKHLVDELKKTSPAVVDGLIPGTMSVAEVQRHFADAAARAGVGAAAGADSRNARRSCDAVEGPDPAHRVRAASAGAADLHALSQRRRRAVRRGARSGARRPDSRRLRAHGARHVHPHSRRRRSSRSAGRSASEIEKLTTANHTPIVLVSPQIRAAVKRVTENHLPQLVVLSFNEITRDTKIVTVGIVSDGNNSDLMSNVE